MAKMRPVWEAFQKSLKEFVGPDRNRGYCLIVWDQEEMLHAEEGRPRLLVRNLAASIGDVIGNTMKDEKVGIDNLRSVILEANDEIIEAALESLGKRVGEDKMQAMAEQYIEEKGIEIVEEEEELADAIGRSAESDDGAGKV